MVSSRRPDDVHGARPHSGQRPIFGKIARPPQSCRAPDLGPALLASVGLAVLKTLGRLYLRHTEATYRS